MAQSQQKETRAQEQNAEKHRSFESAAAGKNPGAPASAGLMSRILQKRVPLCERFSTDSKTRTRDTL
jgi:hypothetical protein